MSCRYSMVIQWSDEDNCYLVHLPEFPWQQFQNEREDTRGSCTRTGSD